MKYENVKCEQEGSTLSSLLPQKGATPPPGHSKAKANMWRGYRSVGANCTYGELIKAGPPWVPPPDGKGGRLFRVVSPTGYPCAGVWDFPGLPQKEVGEWEHRFLHHGVEMFVEGGDVYNGNAIRHLGLGGESEDWEAQWRQVGFDGVEAGLLRGDIVLIHR